MLILQMNPLNLPGPQFLLLYILLMIVAAIIGRLIKRSLVSPQWSNMRRINLDPYEAAYLRGGARQAIDAAVAVLAQKRALEISKTVQTIRTTAAPLPAGTHWFEKAVHQAIGLKSGCVIADIRSSSSLTRHTDRLTESLKQWDLVPSDSRWRVARTVSMLVVLAVLALGIAKIMVGISRNRPVGFLIFLCILTGIIMLVVYNSRPARTRLGDQALKQLQDESAALRMAARTQPDLLASGDVALAIGLFGITSMAFADDSWTNLKAALQQPQTLGSSSSSSSGCGSSSSCSSSCGGGGGCGGCGGG